MAHGADSATSAPPTSGPINVPIPSIVLEAALLATSSSGARASDGIRVM